MSDADCWTSIVIDGCVNRNVNTESDMLQLVVRFQTRADN